MRIAVTVFVVNESRMPSEGYRSENSLLNTAKSHPDN